MATPSQAQAVKSLDTSSSRKRFTFKTFSERLQEIDITENVYRSLHKQKPEPSEGSTFFRDCLIEWRELNTAEDFNSLYEETMPLVQTLPQVLFHKETIMSKLLSRVHMKGRLSLEPILELIAALSRDLLKDFLPFLKMITDALVNLLKNGAEREPEVIKQVVTSWSDIMNYLKKYLMQDIAKLLKDTRHLRYYSKSNVDEFMAESVSVVFRVASDKQLTTGVRGIIQEVLENPSHVSGASALLWHIMKGSTLKLHSRAGRVLKLLTSSSITIIGGSQGASTVVEVVTASFQRLCEELHPKELKVMWDCLFDDISSTIGDGNLLQLSHLLALLISSIQFCNGGKVSDYQPMLDLVNLLVQKYIKPDYEMDGDHVNEVIYKVLQLMLCLLDGLLGSNDASSLACVSLEWAPIFELKNINLKDFIKELIQKDPCVSDAFRCHILSALNYLVEASPSEEVTYLMLTFCKKLQATPTCFCEISEEKLPKLCNFLRESLTMSINDITHKDPSVVDFSESKLAVLWGVLSCYPHISSPGVDASLILDFLYAFDQLQADKVSGVPECTLQGLVGAAITSYHKLQLREMSALVEKTKLFLNLAQKYRSSPQVLSAVAEFLDSVQGSSCEVDTTQKAIHPELGAESTVKAVNIFSENMGRPEDVIRISTLRILNNYERLGGRISCDEPAQKKLKTEGCQPFNRDSDCNDVIQLLLSIETAALSITTSRRVILLISQIQMGLSVGKISEDYVPLLLNGIIGIFHKCFSPLWEPAQECLTVLIDKHLGLVWDTFVCYLEQCQFQFLTSGTELWRTNGESSSQSSDLVVCFGKFLNPSTDCTPCTTVMSLLLQSLQKLQHIAESKSRRLVPLFLTFLGYNDDSVSECNVGSFNSHPCKGKEWRTILKEWLNLLKLMRNSRSLYRSLFLKKVLIKRLLDETDADIQSMVLDCLLNWKDDFLIPYAQHLTNLVTSKNLREELATWTLSKEAHHIDDSHRECLIPIVVRLLIPKVRNLKTLASRKSASVHHRRAILCSLAQLETNELVLFFVLLIKPLQLKSNENKGLSKWFWSSHEISLEEFQACDILKYFTDDKLTEISLKKRNGFLHVFEDIFKSFSEFHLRPFLNLLMGLLVRIMESCTVSLDEFKGKEISQVLSHQNENLNTKKASGDLPMTSTMVKQLKDQRSLSLKIISMVLNKYEGHDFGCEFWDIFFKSIKALVDGFKQEGASSERPSSLFSCFLAMSRSHTLVPLFLREESLVPTIFSVLTVKSASHAITVSVIAFIENLLNLDSDLDNHENSAIQSVLIPNLSPLINSLYSFFQCHNDSRRNSNKWPGKMELRVFKLLSKYINDPSDAMKFVDILLPFLSKKAQNSDELLAVLHVIQEIVPRIGTSETTGKIIYAVAALLISAGLDVRKSICDLLEGVTLSDPTVASLAKLVRELNATSASEIDELDYDTRVNAYEKCDQKFFSTIREDHAVVLLSHSVYDMSSEELILRQSAYRLFLSFVNFSALVLDSEANKRQELSEPVVAVEIDPCWTKACILRIIKKFFLKYMGQAMNKGISIQREWVSLLRDMVLRLPQIRILNSVKELCSKDTEVDFFNNILHLQIHRRAKALTRFRKAIEAGDFSEMITKKVFVPLFFKMLFDIQDGQREHLRNACLESLAAISGHMEWESYHAFLLRCFREMTLKPGKQKVLLRLICHILDNFHFSESSINQKTDTVCEIMNPGIIGICSMSTLHTKNNDISSEIQACLQKTVFPKIQKLLSADSDKVNVTINLAALKLLKLLPVDTMESHLSSIIHRVCNFLKNRLESIRDEARQTLAACSKELGLEYMQFIIKVLRATLKRGYELHVLGYTLNFILSKALRTPSTGKLDYCLEEILSVAEKDILGDVAEEKEVGKIASKMKETKKLKSFETLKLISQSVTFKTHALKLLSPVKSHLQDHLTPKLKARLEKMLNHIAEGIQSNPSVDQTDLFVSVYGLIEDGILEENLQGRDSSAAKSSKQLSSGVTDKRKSSPWVIGYKSQSSHLITVFSLRVLHNRLKSMKLDKKDEHMLSLLDPFVKILSDCLKSKFEDILSTALRCLGPLIRLPLPSLEIHAENIKTLLLDIAQKSGNTSTPLLQSCLSLLTILLGSTNITLSNDQLHMLIQFPVFVDLERNPSFVALLLLKAIVSRKLVVPEIFDVVTRVAELIVQSQVEPIRKKCSQILLRFLRDYPLSRKRLQQHLDFLLSNLTYEHSAGREAVLEMLHAIIVKLNKNVVEEHSQTFFIHLVVCLANDQDSKVRSMIGAALKLLIGRTSQSSLSSILEYSLSWYLGEKQNLWSAAAQVLGLIVEVLKTGFRRHINKALPAMKRILKSALCIEQPGFSDEAMLPVWRETYYSLVFFEKLLLQFPELYFDNETKDMWEAVCEFLLYQHIWIRNISSRLVASYFAAVSEARRTDTENLAPRTFLLMRPSRLFSIAVSSCCQLKGQLTDDVANMFITQNLIFAICGVHSILKQGNYVGLEKFWSALAVHEQDLFVKAFQLLGSKKGTIMLASLSDEKVQNVEDNSKDLHSLLVSPLLRRLGKVALQMEDIQMKIVFNCFRTISSQIGQESCQRYAINMLYPLYKVCEGFAGKVIADDIKQLADEVRRSIQGIMGVENFIRVYNEIRKNVKAKRDKRQQQEKLMAAINPMRNAKRKLRMAVKNRAYKKRKIMMMKKGR